MLVNKIKKKMADIRVRKDEKDQERWRRKIKEELRAGDVFNILYKCDYPEKKASGSAIKPIFIYT